MAEAARSHSTSHKLAEFTWDDAFLLNEQLTELRDSGTYDEIYNKYFSTN